ncbi:MAG TPA: BBP7 family outer membrane beta-barrel protein, partial [Planctomycetaceae bacterium]|nr:BBP7 family outer membrane beta-barrel protein [Planctomycetaceae bacterium]
ALEISPFERWFSKVARNMWIRIEYLNYDVFDPGEKLIGNRTRTGDARVPFNILEPDPLDPTTLLIAGRARAEDLGGISYLDTDGIRGTIGVPYRKFDYEWSWWAFEQNADVVRANIPTGNQTPGNAFLTVVPTLRNGQLRDDTFLFFDDSFEARAHVESWGTDMKWLFKRSPQWPGLRVDPLIEARFLQLHENMHVVGVFTGESAFAGPLANPLVTIIDSDSMNHIYGAGAGLSVRFVTPWVTFGVEPRGSLALNTYRSRVVAENVLANGVSQRTVDDGTTFSPTAELSAYFRLHPTPHCTIVGGYNALFVARVARPYESVRYDLLTDPVTGQIVSSDISVDTDFRMMLLHGFSIGAEFTFK